MSAVLGAVLLFGFLAIGFTVYQGVVIPNQNEAVELAHNEQIRDSLQELRNAILAAGQGGPERSVAIELGADYPKRAVGVNFGSSAGSLRTASNGAITLRNVTATDGETMDYFGASNSTLGPFATDALVYRPTYTYYATAPVTRYEHTVLYNEFPNGANRSLADQVLVDGRRITLLTLAGNLSAAQSAAVSVDTASLSPASHRVSVTNTDGPITITLRSRLSAATWTELLSEEHDPDGTASQQFVAAVKQTAPDEISIVLERGVTYDLALAKVGVGTGADAPPPRYITDISGDNASVPEGGTWKLVAEVRDRYNNPVSNVSVSATVTSPANASDSAETVAPRSRTTAVDGQASFVYTAPAAVDRTRTATVELTFSGGRSATEVVTVELSVLDLDGAA